jgi:hypothetical protein
MEGLLYVLDQLWKAYAPIVLFAASLIGIFFLLRRRTKKRLLILDMNKLLVFRAFQFEGDPKGSILLGQHRTWIRPKVQIFLDFCFQNYDVAVWSSANAKNLDALIGPVIGPYRNRLVFIWSQEECERIETGKEKPLFKKPLSKVVQKFDYFMEEILIIDDSPEKMVDNPTNCVLITKEWKNNKEEETLEDIIKSISVK